MKRGKYFVIEGGEGCGKGTQSNILIARLRELEIPVEYGREPGGVQEAEAIRTVLLGQGNDFDPFSELCLFEAARREFFAKRVRPFLKQGVTIVSDRSGLSSLAYQGYAGRVNLKLIKTLNEIATMGVKPDLEFIIDVPVKVGLAKETEPDRFAAKGREYHEKVNQGYRELAKEDGRILIPYIINGSEQMHDQIWRHVEPILKT